jgi:DNA processing protein
MTDKELTQWLWLADALRPAVPNLHDIMAAFSTPEELLQARFSQDLRGVLTPGQLHRLRETEPEDFVARLDDCKRCGVQVVPWGSEEYPSSLRKIQDPPTVLYCRGDLSALRAPLLIAIVGTRRPSAYGVEATERIAKGLAQAGAVLVSGLAAGLDSEAHRAAVKTDTPTIACIAFGHDKCYPASNRTLKGLIERQGLVLGEYPPGTDIHRSYFLQRNRIIAGLCHGICVAEARRVSGTMNTVAAALEYGRDVFSVPGSIFSPLCEGTNALLRQGAIPATCAQDVLEWYGLTKPERETVRLDAVRSQPRQVRSEPMRLADAPSPTRPARAPAAPLPTLSEDAQKIKAALSCTPVPLTLLCEKVQMPVGTALAALTQLELVGVARQHAGRMFALVN